MQIIKTSILHGPNIYGPQQYISHTLKFEAFSEASSPGFNRAFVDELYHELPGLCHHDPCCAASTEFEQAILLNDPFPIAHLLEHICIELQNIIGLDLKCARCHAGYQIQNHQMVYPFDIEEVGMLAAKLALNWLNSLLRDAKQQSTHVVEKGGLLGQIPLEDFLAKENGQPAKIVASAEFAASLATRLNVTSKLISRELGCVKSSVSVHRI